MPLGNLTKQLAQQALLSAATEPAPVPHAPADSTGAVIFSQLSAMQKALKEDEELVVLFQQVRVMEIFLPSPQVAVLSGLDANRVLTRVISPVALLQLVCKTAKAAPGTKPARVALIAPKT